MKKNSFVLVGVVAGLLLVGASCSPFGGSSAPTTSGPAGVFISTDKAETWKSISILPQPGEPRSLENVSVYKLKVDEHDSNTLYWSSRGNGLFYSYDLGKTWQLAPSPLHTGFIYDVAVNPRDKCLVYATNGSRIFASTDCATRSWSEVYREPAADRINTIVTDKFSPGRVYALKTRGDILVSNDTGISWQVLKSLKTNTHALYLDPYREGVIYVATEKKGLYRSEDGGATWTSTEKALKGFTGGTQFRRFVMSPTKEGEVYWISTYGILKSTDSGNTWTPFNTLNSPGSIKIYGFAINPKKDDEMYYTGTIENRSVLYKTIDGGQSWITKKLPSDQVPTSIVVHPEKEGTLLLGFTIPPKQ